MPKTPSRCNLKSSEDEDRILETIKCQPEVLDSFNKVFTGGRKKQQTNCEKLADELNCTADILKRVWLKIQPNDEMKSVRDSTETRPRSARSNWMEPREARRSLRSQSIEKTTSWTGPSAVYDSTDNSCASSSSCSSPKSEEHRLQQQQQPACRSLDAINEEDNLEFGNAEVVSHHRSAVEETEDETKTDDCGSSPNQEDASNVGASDIGANDHRQVAPNLAVDDAEHVARASTVIKYLDASQSSDSSKKSRSLCFPEMMKTPRNSQSLHSSRRSSISGHKEERNKNNSSVKILSNLEDSTRVFFDSISLTVMHFPQHLQASVKAQVSKIVHELEYKLSMPAYVPNSSIAVA